MSYFQALSFVRWALQTPWLPPGSAQVTQTEALAFTLHSLKTCLLSASAQLRLSEDSRRLQGHRKLSSAHPETIEALWLQRQLSTAARGGWRPPQPQARGGQRPTIEPPFVLPGPCSRRRSQATTQDVDVLVPAKPKGRADLGLLSSWPSTCRAVRGRTKTMSERKCVANL